MARGKFLSFEEARKANKLAQFARETGYQKTDARRFDRLLQAMASGKAPASGKRPAKGRTSNARNRED